MEGGGMGVGGRRRTITEKKKKCLCSVKCKACRQTWTPQHIFYTKSANNT